MRRRAALGTLLGLGCSAFARRDDDAAGALAWGDDGVWTASVGAAVLEPLPGAYPAAAAAPVASALGVWALAGLQRIALWQRSAERWHLAAAGDTGEAVHALQASSDGRFALAAHGEQLSLFDAQGVLLRRYAGSDLARRQRGRATVLRRLSQRRSFVVAWDALAEWWEISHDPAAPPVFDGLVHDYRMGEAIASAGYLGVRRTPLERPLPQLGFADARVPWAVGLQDGHVQVIHLDVRRRIATWALPGAALSASLLRREADRWVWWLPAGRELQRVDAARWQPLGREALPGVALALQAVGDSVWLLGAQAGTNGLWRRQDGDWLPLLAGEEPQALQADAAGRRVLLATARPARLRLLDNAGHTIHTWELPAPLRGLDWLPNGA